MKAQRRTRHVVLLFVLLLCALGQAWPQSATEGGIGGTVYDRAGAAVAGARVTIQNQGTGAGQAALTSGQGYFRIPNLEPGIYNIEITAGGFAPFKAENVTVTVGSVTGLEPRLEAAGAFQQVEVSGAAQQINLESPEFSASLSQVAVDNLPINGRRWSDFALLTPGVTSDSTGYGLLSFRGISTLLNNMTVDGADNNQAFFSEERGRSLRVGYSTSQVAVQEFQVNTSNYSAEYGRSAGGVVNTVTKSGSNQFHGELFFYDRDSDWGATNPFTTLTQNENGSFVTTAYKPRDWRKQFGFGVGGPILRERLFFFYAFDRFLRNFPGTAVVGSPSTFFAAPTSAQISLLAQRLGASQATAQQDYVDGLNQLNGLLGTVPRTGDQYLNFPKLDWQVNSANHASFQYNRMHWTAPGDVIFLTSAAYGKRSFGNDFTKVDWGLARLDSMLSMTLANELRYQYGRDFEYETNQQPTPYEQALGNNQLGRPPQISVAGSNGLLFGTLYYEPRKAFPDERRQQVTDTVTWQHGDHTFKAGVDYNHVNDRTQNLDYVAGAYTYTTLLNYLSDYYASLEGSGGVCNAAGTGAGAPGNSYPCYSSFLQAIGPPGFTFATSDYAGFVTDSWKIRPRLTLTVGLRYEYEQLPASYSNLQNATLPQTATLPSDKNNFGPRFGFAYDVLGTGKTVVRGGYGIFYGRLINSTIDSVITSTGSLQGVVRYTYTPTTAGALAFPGILQSAPAAGAKPSALFFDHNFQNPQIQQIDLSVQQDVGWNSVLSVSYLGSLGRHLPDFADTNIDTANVSTITYNVVDSSGRGPIKTPTYSTTFYYNRLNPNYSNITDVFSGVNTSYNALVAEIAHRMNRHVQFDAHYAWAHALDFGENATTFYDANDLLVPNKLGSEHGNSNFNVPNRFVFDAILESPWRVRGWMGLAANDWSLAPIFQAQDGLPYSLVTSGAPSLQTSTGATLRPLGSSINGSGGAARIDVTGRNTYKYPSTSVLDLRLSKRISFAERYQLELLGEAFNLFNHQNVTGINNTGYVVNGASTANGRGTLTFNATSAGMPLFGSVTNSGSNVVYTPRQIQLALRLHF